MRGPVHRAPFACSPIRRLARLDFREVTPQDKPDLATFPSSVPAPTRFYALTEGGAGAFSDGADGTQDLSVFTAGASLLRQRIMQGLSADGLSMTSYTGIEMEPNSTAQSASVANGTFLDVGAAGSAAIAVAILFRRGRAPTANRNFIRKRDNNVVPQGWRMGMQAAGVLRAQVTDTAGTNGTADTVSNYIDGAWHIAIVVVDRLVAEQVKIITELELVTGNIAALLSLSNAASAIPFGIGNVAGVVGIAENLQIAAMYTWEGANAAALTLAHAQTLFQHGIDPTGQLTTYTRAGRATEQVGYTAGFGDLVLDYSGLSGGGRTAQVGIGYRSTFAHASRLGIRANPAVTNLVTDSDDYSVAAWTKTNVTVSGIAASLVDGPSRFRNAQLLTATANNATLEDAVVTVASTQYTLSVYARSRSAGNVNARLQFWNITAGAELGGLDVVLTQEWQRFDLTLTTAVGQIASGLRMRINTSGDAISMSLANFYLGPRNQLVRTSGASATMPATNITVTTAAGAWVLGARGEIDAYAVCDADDAAVSRYIVSATGAANSNRRDISVITGQQSRGTIYDNAGALDHNIDSAVFDHRVAFTERLLWRTPSPPVIQPDILSVLRSNAASVNGSNVAWATGNTVVTINVGQVAGGGTQLGGLVALLDFWNLPRASYPPFPPA